MVLCIHYALNILSILAMYFSLCWYFLLNAFHSIITHFISFSCYYFSKKIYSWTSFSSLSSILTIFLKCHNWILLLLFVHWVFLYWYYFCIPCCLNNDFDISKMSPANWLWLKHSSFVYFNYFPVYFLENTFKVWNHISFPNFYFICDFV